MDQSSSLLLQSLYFQKLRFSLALACENFAPILPATNSPHWLRPPPPSRPPVPPPPPPGPCPPPSPLVPQSLRLREVQYNFCAASDFSDLNRFVLCLLDSLVLVHTLTNLPVHLHWREGEDEIPGTIKRKGGGGGGTGSLWNFSYAKAKLPWMCRAWFAHCQSAVFFVNETTTDFTVQTMGVPVSKGFMGGKEEMHQTKWVQNILSVVLKNIEKNCGDERGGNSLR